MVTDFHHVQVLTVSQASSLCGKYWWLQQLSNPIGVGRRRRKPYVAVFRIGKHGLGIGTIIFRPKLSALAYS
jgi:hypothetical protein